MKRFVNAFGNAVLTILIILLLGYGFVFIETKILLKSNPELFGYVFYIQPDDRMMDDFYEKDVIIIKKNETYKKGEMIFYIGDNNKYYVRRASSVSDTFTTIKCNTCINKEKQVDNQKVKGKVIGKILFLGQLISFLKNKIVIIILAAVGFASLIISQYMAYKPRKVKKKTKNIDIKLNDLNN